MAAAIALLTEGIYLSGAVGGLENFYSDRWHRIAGQRFEPRHTALVMIDDPSLAEKPDEPLVFGVSVWDPTTYLGVSGVLAVVALASCLVPAVRASRVDPMTALRLD